MDQINDELETEREFWFNCATENGENGNCPIGRKITCRGCRYNRRDYDKNHRDKNL